MPSFSPFLGGDDTDLERSRFVVFPVPYERTTTYGKGCAHGPRSILAASTQVETFDEEAGLEPCDAGINTAPAFEDDPAPQDLPSRLQAQVEPWAMADKFVVTVGGEHSVALGPIRAYRTVYPDLSVLHVDAHADLRDVYDDTPFSHACVMRRVQEHCPVVQVGIRSLSAEEDRDRHGMNVITFFRHETDPLTMHHISRIISHLSPVVYLSFDIDGLDPSIAPATGTPEPGGLSWREASDLIRELALTRKLVGMDVTEVSPRPVDVLTQFTAARLIHRTMAWTLRGK